MVFVVLFAVAAKIFMGEFFQNIGIAGFWNGIPSLYRYRPALEYRPVTDFYGIPAEGYPQPTCECQVDFYVLWIKDYPGLS